MKYITTAIFLLGTTSCGISNEVQHPDIQNQVTPAHDEFAFGSASRGVRLTPGTIQIDTTVAQPTQSGSNKPQISVPDIQYKIGARLGPPIPPLEIVTSTYADLIKANFTLPRPQKRPDTISIPGDSNAIQSSSAERHNDAINQPLETLRSDALVIQELKIFDAMGTSSKEAFTLAIRSADDQPVKLVHTLSGKMLIVRAVSAAEGSNVAEQRFTVNRKLVDNVIILNTGSENTAKSFKL